MPIPCFGYQAGASGSRSQHLWRGNHALTFYAFGEGILVLLAMEENTRATAFLLQQNRREPAAPPEEVEPPEER